MEKQLVQRICDTCGFSFTFASQGLTPEEIMGISKWVATVVFEGTPDGPQPVVKHYCGRAHAIEALTPKTVEVYAEADVLSSAERLEKLRNLVGGTN